MNPNVLLMTLVIAFEPIPILGGVLLLTAKRGRPKPRRRVATISRSAGPAARRSSTGRS